MKKNYRLPGVIAVAVLLAGCGSDSGDYSKYVTLGDYKDLSAELVTEPVTDQDLDDYAKDQLGEYATFDEVDGPAKEGQLVTVSLLAKEGEEVVYDFSDDGYEMTIGQQDFGTEVDEALTGGVVGDVLDLSVSYDDDFGDALLCGKDIDFHIEIQSVADVKYAELTDEFVKENFGEQSVEEWRNSLKEEMQSERQAEAEEDLRSELVQKAVDASEITGYPKELYKQKKELIQADYQSYADMFGCSLDEVYEMFEVDEKTREEEYLNETYRTMVLTMIRKQENISLSDEQMQEKMQTYAEENEYDSVEELLGDYEKDDLKAYFLDEMTIDFLEDHADIKVSGQS